MLESGHSWHLWGQNVVVRGPSTLHKVWELRHKIFIFDIWFDIIRTLFFVFSKVVVRKIEACKKEDSWNATGKVIWRKIPT